MKKTLAGLGIATLALTFVLAGPEPAQATMELHKAAKAAGFEATNCQYCHLDKLPKKSASNPNERGQWLIDQKAAKKADKVDVTWLKDYVEKKK